MEEKEIPSFKGLWLDVSSFKHPVLKKLDPTSRIVYQYLFFRSNDNLETWSYNSQIAKDLVLNLKTVEPIIPKLHKKYKVVKIIKSEFGRRVVKCLYSLKIGLAS